MSDRGRTRSPVGPRPSGKMRPPDGATGRRSPHSRSGRQGGGLSLVDMEIGPRRSVGFERPDRRVIEGHQAGEGDGAVAVRDAVNHFVGRRRHCTRVPGRPLRRRGRGRANTPASTCVKRWGTADELPPQLGAVEGEPRPGDAVEVRDAAIVEEDEEAARLRRGWRERSWSSSYVTVARPRAGAAEPGRRTAGDAAGRASGAVRVVERAGRRNRREPKDSVQSESYLHEDGGATRT